MTAICASEPAAAPADTLRDWVETETVSNTWQEWNNGMSTNFKTEDENSRCRVPKTLYDMLL